MTPRISVMDIPLVPRRFRCLSEWLAWQETLHVKEIELGLERCRAVAERMGLRPPAYYVVTVGGTNGKGSSVMMLDCILRSGGYKVATYTSPHLLHYNERVRIGGQPLSDDQLCEAFQHVDEARGDISLTYFEFGTLAALDIFQRADIDIAILEVGLGGRLDAVNLVDPEVALITAIGVDHVEWLGHDRATIAREKAGIFRPGRPAVCSDPSPPWTLSGHAERLRTPLYLLGRDYLFEVSGASWSWHSGWTSYSQLPRPSLHGDYQLQNAAGVLMVLQMMAEQFPIEEDAVRRSLVDLRLAGRFQILPGPVKYILDVAHNPQAAGVLAQTLKQYPANGRTHVLIGMLKDKDARGVFRELSELADHWYVAGLDVPRGAASQQLAYELIKAGVTTPVARCTTVAEALATAQSQTHTGDRILVTGSFLTVAGVMKLLEAQDLYRF